MIPRSIALVLRNDTEAETIVLQTHGVAEDVTTVQLPFDKEQFQAKMHEVGEKLRTHLHGIAVQLSEDTKTAGLLETFVTYMGTLEVDHNAKVPDEFRGTLRKRVARLASLLRKNATDPASLVKGYLIGTENGLVLNLWVHTEELVLLNEVVEPINVQDIVDTKTLLEQSVTTLSDLAPFTEELTMGQELGKNVEVTLIHPAQKPIILNKPTDPGLDGDEFNTPIQMGLTYDPNLNPKSARSVTTALAQRFTRHF